MRGLKSLNGAQENLKRGDTTLLPHRFAIDF